MKPLLASLVKLMPRRVAMGLVMMLVTIGAVGATTVVEATPASASATHCAWVGPFYIQGKTIPTGQYCFSLNGSGLHVNFTLSSYWSPWVENLAERVDAFDVYGRTYGSWWTWAGYGNLYGTHAWYGISGNFRPGSLCGTLYSNGVQIARVCNGVHA